MVELAHLEDPLGNALIVDDDSALVAVPHALFGGDFCQANHAFWPYILLERLNFFLFFKKRLFPLLAIPGLVGS